MSQLATIEISFIYLDLKDEDDVCQKGWIVIKLKLSRSMTKLTKWLVRPAKTHTSLSICAVWPESSLAQYG